MDVSTLHPLELKLLRVLSKQPMEFSDVVKNTGLNPDQVRRAISWLTHKGMINEKIEVKEEYKFTPLGENYLKTGLPEVKLLTSLMQGKELNEVKLNQKELSAAIGVCKRKNYLNTAMNVTEEGKMFLNQWKEYLKSHPEEYERRGITQKVIQKQKFYYLTEEGVKARELSKNIKQRTYDFSSRKPVYLGLKNPYVNFMNEIKQKLVGLGFEEIRTNIVENEFWNMDALFMPQFHPARTTHDVYYIENPKLSKQIDNKYVKAVKRAHEKGISGSKGWRYKFDINKSRRLIPRSHGTASSARILPFVKSPGKYFTIARCFRKDEIDATHLPDFYQLDGIVVSENTNIRTLLGMLSTLVKELSGINKLRFYPAYFPYTEPSVEVFAYHEKHGWIEMGGAGIFRPEVTKPFGIKSPVIAWGLGFDRMAMFKLRYNDIRDLFTTDLERLRSCQQ